MVWTASRRVRNGREVWLPSRLRHPGARWRLLRLGEPLRSVTEEGHHELLRRVASTLGALSPQAHGHETGTAHDDGTRAPYQTAKLNAPQRAVRARDLHHEATVAGFDLARQNPQSIDTNPRALYPQRHSAE